MQNIPVEWAPFLRAKIYFLFLTWKKLNHYCTQNSSHMAFSQKHIGGTSSMIFKSVKALSTYQIPEQHESFLRVSPTKQGAYFKIVFETANNVFCCVPCIAQNETWNISCTTNEVLQASTVIVFGQNLKLKEFIKYTHKYSDSLRANLKVKRVYQIHTLARKNNSNTNKIEQHNEASRSL